MDTDNEKSEVESSNDEQNFVPPQKSGFEFKMETDNEKYEVESSDDDEKNLVPPKKSDNKRMSKSWLFFDRDNDMFATCKICKKSLNHRSGLSNLMKHIKRAHHSHFQRIHGDLQPGQGDESIGIDDINYLDYDDKSTKSKGNEDEEANSNNSSFKHSVWRYFTLLDKSLKIASCKFCSKRIDYISENELLRHLKKRHDNNFIPNKNVRILVTDDNKLFEVEDLRQTKEETSDKYDHFQNLERDESTDSDEPRKKRIKIKPLSKKQVKEDQIDLFTKYLSSLLRKLPTQVSNKLQADFIRQTMEVSVTGTQEQVQVPSIVVLPSEN